MPFTESLVRSDVRQSLRPSQRLQNGSTATAESLATGLRVEGFNLTERCDPRASAAARPCDRLCVEIREIGRPKSADLSQRIWTQHPD